MASLPRLSIEPQDEAGSAYDTVGDAYRRYADGEGASLFDFSSRYSFADREIWRRINAALIAARAEDRRRIRIVDAGCGPGTWLIRCALRARTLGFTVIEGRGFDISPAMIHLAREAAAHVHDDAIALEFGVADIAEGLSRETGRADLVLCLYGVLNHLPAERHRSVAAALAQAGRSLFVTVRTVGSLPSIFVTGLEDARDFHQDHEHDRLEIDLADGRHLGFPSHLFAADEFQALFIPHGHIAERVGLDLFHGRFAPDARWNPPAMADGGFDEALTSLEHLCASDPRFIDRAAHVLLHVEREHGDERA